MGRKPLPINCCIDCKIYALENIEDYYIVTDDLWKEFGCGKGLLCWDCFQKRMDRKFKKSDFIECNANKQNPLIQNLKE